MRIRDSLQQLEDALAPLVAAGWRIARIEVCYDDTDGEFVNLRLCYEPPGETGGVL